MSDPLLARWMLTAIAAGQGIGPLIIDLNRTHAMHPLWIGHARFHLVWQSLTLALMSAAGIALLWIPGTASSERFYFAATLTALPIAGFLIALFTRSLYGGTLHDVDGIPPVRIGRISFDLNAVIVVFAAFLLGTAVLLF